MNKDEALASVRKSELAGYEYDPAVGKYRKPNGRTYFTFLELRKKLSLEVADALLMIEKSGWLEDLNSQMTRNNDVQFSASVQAMLDDLNGPVKMVICSEEQAPRLFYDTDTGKLVDRYHEDSVAYMDKYLPDVKAGALLVKRRVLEPYAASDDAILRDENGMPEFVNLYCRPDWRKQSRSGDPANWSSVAWFLRHLFCNDSRSIMFAHAWIQYLLLHGKNESALTLIGAKGLGKNLFFDHILKPLVGEDYCGLGDKNTFLEKFNGALDGKILVLFDELELDDAGISSFRRYFNSRISIEHKGRDAVIKRNLANFVIFANEPEKVRVVDDDRRFSIPEVGKVKLTDALEGKPVGDLIDKLNAEVFEYGAWLLAQKFDYRCSDFLVTDHYGYIVRSTKAEWQIALDEMFDTREIGDPVGYKEMLSAVAATGASRKGMTPKSAQDYLERMGGYRCQKILGVLTVEKV